MYVKQSLFEAEKEAKELSIKNPNIVYYLDCCFYSAWVAWKRSFTLNSTINDFLSILGNKLGEEWSEDNEYQYSDDGIIEMIEANDYEFLEDGKQY